MLTRIVVVVKLCLKYSFGIPVDWLSRDERHEQRRNEPKRSISAGIRLACLEPGDIVIPEEPNFFEDVNIVEAGSSNSVNAMTEMNNERHDKQESLERSKKRE